MTSLSPETIAAWTSLISVSTAVLDRIETALKRAGLPPLSWYDALLEIEKAGPEGIRPFELKARLLLAQYSTSRLLDRIETAGLITRRACDGDGRGQLVVLSAAGEAMRRRMWPVYAGLLAELVEHRLDAEDRAQLAGLLAKLHPNA